MLILNHRREKNSSSRIRLLSPMVDICMRIELYLFMCIQIQIYMCSNSTYSVSVSFVAYIFYLSIKIGRYCSLCLPFVSILYIYIISYIYFYIYIYICTFQRCKLAFTISLVYKLKNGGNSWLSFSPWLLTRGTNLLFWILVRSTRGLSLNQQFSHDPTKKFDRYCSLKFDHGGGSTVQSFAHSLYWLYASAHSIKSRHISEFFLSKLDCVYPIRSVALII